ncbi:hypothetical protein LPB73_07620 [Tardiphaga sp. 37S4]|uniref:hypothetical protein n=1 Tax=Tardiphaga sp. 37S4 TaxID=1404741 RepID=UPI001E3F99A0|nr:hypothetical protein [Tardiphaga sp. 37S4]UFS77236.1 hypothetical protein LPB73_07620 [Tardiphaga sp. 37S4]
MTAKSVDLTEPQRVLLTMLTDQRVANLLNLSDIIGDMNADGLEFLRRLGDPRFEALTNFLSHAKPETLTFLTEARPEEVANLQEGIRLVVALQLLGRISKWGAVTFFGVFVSMVLIWEKVSAWLKAR